MAKTHTIPASFLLVLLAFVEVFNVNATSGDDASRSRYETEVLVIGAGTAGITAAKKLSDNGIPFLILEATNRIGGRILDGEFDGMRIEYGAHWLHDLDANPLWPFAQEIGLQGEIDDYDSIKMIKTGGVDVTEKYEQLAERFRNVEMSLEKSKALYQKHCVDDPDKHKCEKLTMCDAFDLAGWSEEGDREMESTSFFIFDWMSGSECRKVSFYSYMQADIEDPHDFMITDPRGFAYLLERMADQYLSKNDDRLRFNEVVTLIDYSDGNLNRFGKQVAVHTKSALYLADYVLVTASNGVILHGDIQFEPQLPDWKLSSIKLMPTMPYTKIFFNFHGQKSIDRNAYVLAVNENGPRGLNTVWQHIGVRKQFSDKELVMVTNLEETGLEYERMNSSELIEAALDSLQEVYPHIRHVNRSQVTESHHCWSCDPFARGAFATTSFGMSADDCENLGKDVAGRVFFAGDGSSCLRFSSVDAAYLSALAVADNIIDTWSAAKLKLGKNEL